ncbi:hypothetical protein CcaverHIS002_0405510 [Cutaneotrichosporon cavernicola]|nr:hypothetical protein CcaverHIS002_0405510 [Cutaneotrichosporon cavernicola]BEI99504.1 hypothetical protein CcaverHIS631_0405470 [Cutaneotrichosporon cavernicola]BEJ07282.1 hypothetical protein CcaverHIS641_0405510 [Cutaneotrichosporon cavernicola]
MADLLDTPSRVLKRVQQYEEMELPSLPSFQRDDLDLSDDYDPESSRESVARPSEHGDSSTPHVGRTLCSPRTASSARTESTVKPLRSSGTEIPTPLAPFRATNRLSNSELDISYDFFMGNLSATDASSTGGANEPGTQYAYEDHSSGSESLAPFFTGSHYFEGTEEYQPSALVTPLPQPPGGSISPFLTAKNTPNAANEVRIPSLSRSEVSSTDNEATTPEGRDPLQLPIDSVDHYCSSKLEAAYDLTTDNLLAARSPSPVTLDSAEATPVAIRYMDQPSTAARAAATPFGVAPLRDVTMGYRNQRPPSPSVDYPNSSRTPFEETAQRKNHLRSVLASNALPPRPSPLRSALALQSSSGSTSATILSDGTTNKSNEDQVSNTSAQSLASQNDHDVRSFTRNRRGSLTSSDLLTSIVSKSAGSFQQLDSVSPFAKIQKHLNKMDGRNASLDADQEPGDWHVERRRLVKIIRDAGLDIDELADDLDSDTSAADDSFSKAPLWSEIASLRAKLQDAHDELANVKSDFTRKTEEHYHMFTDIGAGYASQIESLQDELGRAKGEVTRRQTQLDMLRPSSVVQEDELRKQIAILGGDLSRAQEDAQVVAEALANAQARLSEAHANEQATLQQLQEVEDRAETLQSQLDSAAREAKLGSHRAKDLQSRLSAAEDKTQTLQSQLDAIQQEGTLATSNTEDLRKRLTATESVSEDRAQQLTVFEARLTDAQSRVEEHVCQSATLEARLLSLEEENNALQADKDAMSQRVSSLERHREDDQTVISDQRKIIRELEDGVTTFTVEIETNKKRIVELEGFVSAAQSTQASSQAELESLKHQLEIARLEATEADEIRDVTVASSPNLATVYEDQLEEAHRLIGRLKAELEGIPARHKTLEDRDARIRALETEKGALLERLKAREMASPARWASSMRMSTPVLHKTVSALRSPRTPGPLKDLSWLQSTIDDSNESLLRAELEHLQVELDAANIQLDKNFDRLEEAGLGAVRLAQELAAAKAKLDEYKEEWTLQGRINREREESLDRGRNKNERLESALDEVHQRLSSLRDNMTAEKERLQEDNRRLRLQLSDMRIKYDDELERLSEETARVQDEAQDNLAQSTERFEQICKEKETLSSQLLKSEELVAQRNREASKLHSSIEDMSAVLDKLRHQLAASAKTQDKVQSLQALLDEAQTSLRSSREDSSRLRNELRLRSDEVADKEQEIKDLAAERQRITRELVQFSEDLTIQRRECVTFGSELQAMRAKQAATRGAHADRLSRLDESFRAKEAELSRATQQLEDARRRCSILQDQLEQVDSQTQATAEQRQKFKAQMRRLSAQIEYLKAVYARENTFRNALALQKKFLILCVGGMSLNEQATLRAIASMGYEVARPPRSTRSFKSVALAVLSLVRARRMAEQWQATRMKRSAGIKRD